MDSTARSWSHVGLLSVAFGVRLFGYDIDIRTHIGFLVLLGLASRNAIFIVEFARQLEAGGATGCPPWSRRAACGRS
jgi:multidrug efflux pump subunit AcrB